MNLTVTAEQLRKLEACDEGVEEFIAFFSGESASAEWTREKQHGWVAGATS